MARQSQEMQKYMPFSGSSLSLALTQDNCSSKIQEGGMGLLSNKEPFLEIANQLYGRCYSLSELKYWFQQFSALCLVQVPTNFCFMLVAGQVLEVSLIGSDSSKKTSGPPFPNS